MLDASSEPTSDTSRPRRGPVRERGHDDGVASIARGVTAWPPEHPATGRRDSRRSGEAGSVACVPAEARRAVSQPRPQRQAGREPSWDSTSTRHQTPHGHACVSSLRQGVGEGVLLPASLQRAGEEPPGERVVPQGESRLPEQQTGVYPTSLVPQSLRQLQGVVEETLRATGSLRSELRSR